MQSGIHNTPTLNRRSTRGKFTVESAQRVFEIYNRPFAVPRTARAGFRDGIYGRAAHLNNMTIRRIYKSGARVIVALILWHRSQRAEKLAVKLVEKS